MPEWYEQRMNFTGCHVLAYKYGQSAITCKLDKFGFIFDQPGIRVFRDTEDGWKLIHPFTACELLWEESEFTDISISEAKPGDYAVVGYHKYKIVEKNDNCLILEGMPIMDTPYELISYCLAKTRHLPMDEGFYTDRNGDVLYQTKTRDWFKIVNDKETMFFHLSEQEVDNLINVQQIELPD